MKRRLRIAALGAAILTTMLGFALPTSASAAVTPNSCQTINLMLETTKKGYPYQCTGDHYFAQGENALWIHPNSWSGLIYYYGAQSPVLFCDNHDKNLSGQIYDLYMSPSKMTGC